MIVCILNGRHDYSEYKSLTNYSKKAVGFCGKESQSKKLYNKENIRFASKHKGDVGVKLIIGEPVSEPLQSSNLKFRHFCKS